MWLVIGYGNDMRSDDGFGIKVAEELQARNISHVSKIISTRQLLPELAEAISDADGVIFVDANSGLAAGRVQCITLASEPASQEAALSTFSHQLTPQELLEGARTLYGRAPKGWLYSAGCKTFELGEQLSPRLKALVPAVASLIMEKIGSN